MKVDTHQCSYYDKLASDLVHWGRLVFGLGSVPLCSFSSYDVAFFGVAGGLEIPKSSVDKGLRYFIFGR